MRRSFLSIVALAGVIACQSSLSPPGNLDGTWEWAFNRNPSGSSITLSIATTGTAVTGTGSICGVGPVCSPGAVTIAGEHTGDGFALTIRDQSALIASYSGQLVSSNELQGTWLRGSDSANVVFYRSAAPR